MAGTSRPFGSTAGVYRHRLVCLLAILSLFTIHSPLATILHAADPGIEFGAADDLSVMGVEGAEADPDVEIKGFTVFGATQAAYTGGVAAPGNVVVNGRLSVSSGAYFAAESTFTAISVSSITTASAGVTFSTNAYFMNGSVGIGTTGPEAKLAINGGLHVGGDTDPGDNNLMVDGALTLGTALAVSEGGTGAPEAAAARTNLGLAAGGAGDIWVEKAGDAMSGDLTVNGNIAVSGTVDGVDISAHAMLVEKALQTIPSDTLHYSDDGETFAAYSAWTLIKSIAIPAALRGSMRIVFDHMDSTGNTGYARIYKNGVAIGTIQSVQGGWATRSEDINVGTLIPGDTIELWGYSSGGFYFVKTRNFRIKYDFQVEDIWVEKIGDTMTGNLTFSGSQKILGGTATTSDLTLQTTSGAGEAGADMHFLVGNNGATEAVTLLNNGNVGIGTAGPNQKLDVSGVDAGIAVGKVWDGVTAYSSYIGKLAAGGGWLDGSAYIKFADDLNEGVRKGTNIDFYSHNHGVATAVAMSIVGDGNVGIGTTSPAAKADIAGGVKVADDTDTCNASKAGTIRWTGAAFQGCTGGAWITFLARGDGTTQAGAGRTCKTILANGYSTGSGIYWIDPDNDGDTSNAFQAYCDMTIDGGGWTLVMRMADDAAFGYTATTYWTAGTLLNSTSLDPNTNTNALYQSYSTVSGTEIRGCRDAGTLCIINAVSVTNAKALFSGATQVLSTSLRASFVATMPPDDATQPNCNQSGINVGGAGGSARFGLVGNNEADCNSDDSAWGWGVVGSGHLCGAGNATWNSGSALYTCRQGTLWVR